ncbi:hypothetical protein [Streptomyces sp. MAR25Y5]|uniref:hypothetical protein n=1 Tax=Streptomyces sp. MAR25Y5 TaxID=2962028 RepID=UPI0020B789F9|nr:hypothetical protein [Streptomyces sp. MAR25Y5]MCP3771074.1 hypothetical protein [Streptomyces sp. MAR25Y5]
MRPKRALAASALMSNAAPICAQLAPARRSASTAKFTSRAARFGTSATAAQ